MMTMVTISGVCCVLMLMDIVSGITAAAKNKELCSSIMRDGLYNKFGELMFLLLGIIAQEILLMPPFNNIGIPPEIAFTVAFYIAGMEFISIIENICKINPSLPFAKILLMFNLNLPEPVDKKEPEPDTK
jgi:toxin secretion/phage lysis holin